jgi:hypothetical protein
MAGPGRLLSATGQRSKAHPSANPLTISLPPSPARRTAATFTAWGKRPDEGRRKGRRPMKTERSRTDLALLSKRLVKQFDDWPEALTLQQIGRLISRTYWKPADPWHGLYERIKAATECGELPMDGPPLAEVRKVPDKQVPYFRVNIAGLGSTECGSETGPRLVQTCKEVTIQIQTIRPAAVARVLKGNDLPEMLAAWIAPWVMPCEENKDLPPSGAMQKTVMQKKHLLESLGVTYPELQSAFKRNDGWLRSCGTEKRGYYHLEDVEAQCVKRWPGRHRIQACSALSVRMVRGGKVRS